jgi:hypothetical protein
MNRILNRSKDKHITVNRSLNESKQRFNTKIMEENKCTFKNI